MAVTNIYKRFLQGIGIVPKDISTNSKLGDIEVKSSISGSNPNRMMFFGASNDAVTTDTVTTTLKNKTINGPDNTITNLTNSNLSGSAAISNVNLATMSANTVKANITGGAATPTDVGVVSTNTASTVVIRDGSGNFSAGTITADLSGNATSTTNISGGILGSIPYQTSANITGLLAGDTSNIRKFLRELSIAGVATAPTWDTIQMTDIPVTAGKVFYGDAGNVGGTDAVFTFNDTTKTLNSTHITATDFTGALIGNASTATSATTATNIAGGAAGSIPYQTGSGATSLLAAGTTNYILRQGASAPAWAVENGDVSCKYSTTAANSTGGGGGVTTIATLSSVWDTHSAMNATTGTYTVPAGQGGKYRVSCTLIVQPVGGSWTGAQSYFMINSVGGGTGHGLMGGMITPSTGTTTLVIHGSILVNCSAGNTINVQTLNQGGLTAGTVSCNGSAAGNYIEIVKVGN